jgi:hypothetical protein
MNPATLIMADYTANTSLRLCIFLLFAKYFQRVLQRAVALLHVMRWSSNVMQTPRHTFCTLANPSGRLLSARRLLV